MDLRQRLSLLTKLAPIEGAATGMSCQSRQDAGFALPSSHHLQPESPAALAHLAAPCLLPELPSFAWEQAAFLDTETTGLSTGTGTYVFLLGVGSFINGVLTIRQYFLPSPEQEKAFWLEVLADLCQYPLLVSFNGKTYDLPLVNTRLTLNGLPPLLPDLHLDLLYPARRLWRRVLQSCALQSLEQHRLDWRREDDVAGALIPALYFEYLQSGDRQPLQAVFQHNRRDIISLFELTAQLAANCAAPEIGFQRAEEFFGLADAHLRAGQEELAAETIVRGLSRPGDQRLKLRYLPKLARLYARAARYPEALATWSELAGLEPLSLLPHVESAKIYEHRLHDLSAAWQSAKRASAVGRRRENLGVPVPAEEANELDRRLQRLQAKLRARSQSSVSPI